MYQPEAARFRSKPRQLNAMRNSPQVSQSGAQYAAVGGTGRRALLCLQVRGVLYEDSSIAAFATDLRRRGLEVRRPSQWRGVPKSKDSARKSGRETRTPCQVSIVPIPAAAIADVPSEVAPVPSLCPLHFCPREFSRALHSRAFPSESAFFKRLHCRSLRGFS